MPWTEVTDRRTATGKTFRDGQQYVYEEIAGTRLHYGENLELEVDLRPQRVTTADFDGWTIEQMPWTYGIGSRSGQGDGWNGAELDGRRLWYRLTQFGWLHWPNRDWEQIGGAPTYDRANLSATAQADTLGPDNDVAVYTQAFAQWDGLWSTPNGGSVSIEWIVEGRRVKEEIVIDELARDWIQANAMPSDETWANSDTYLTMLFKLDGYQDFTWNVDTTDGSDVDGRIELRDAVGDLLFYMPLDEVWSSGDQHQRVRLYKRVFTNTQGTWLAVGARLSDLATLPAGSLRFDPTLNLQPDATAGLDSWIYQFSSGTNYGTNGEMGFYLNVARALLEFDYSSIPSTATVDTANVELYHQSSGGSGFTMRATRLIPNWVESEVTWNIYSTGNNWGSAGCNSDGTDYDSTPESTTTAAAVGAWSTWSDSNLVSIIQSWVDGTYTNNGFRLTGDENDISYWSSSDNGTSSQRPKTSVSYTESGASISAAVGELTAGGEPASVGVNQVTITTQVGELTTGGEAAAVSSGASTTATAYGADLRDVYNADEVWQLVDMPDNTTIPALIDANRAGTGTGISANQYAFLDGQTAPYFDGTAEGDLYTSSLGTLFDYSVGSISIWVRVSDATQWSDSATQYIMYGQGPDSGNDFDLEINPTADTVLTYWEGQSTTPRPDVDHTFSGGGDTEWHHYVITWDTVNGELRLYVDGTEVTNSPATTNVVAWASALTWWAIGARGGTSNFTGHLAYIALWAGTELTAATVQSIYSAATSQINAGVGELTASGESGAIGGSGTVAVSPQELTGTSLTIDQRTATIQSVQTWTVASTSYDAELNETRVYVSEDVTSDYTGQDIVLSTNYLTVEDLPSAPGMDVFQAGDYIGLRQFDRSGGALSIAWHWGTVSGTPIHHDDDTQSWEFTPDGSNAGTASGEIPEGTLALDFGTSPGGYYEVNAIDGLWAQNSPYNQIVTWTDHPANRTVRTRTGNLRGVFSVADEYGFYAGNGPAASDQYVRISNEGAELNNLDLIVTLSSVPVFKIDASVPSYALGDPIPVGYAGTSPNPGIWAGLEGGVYKWRVGDPDTQYIGWDGTNLTVVGSITITNTIDSTDISDVEAFDGTAASVSETATLKWAAESGADVTGNNTANNTDNVGTVPAVDVAGWAYTDTTYIDGGNIYTNTITANQIQSGTITSNEIAANTITAGEIAANTITSNELNVSQLSAITADMGTLTAGQIQLGSGTLSTDFSGVVLDASGITYDSTSWNIVGLNNEVVQVGIRAADGVLVGGGGVVRIDVDGVEVLTPNTTGTFIANSYKFVDSSGNSRGGVFTYGVEGTKSGITIFPDTQTNEDADLIMGIHEDWNNYRTQIRITANKVTIGDGAYANSPWVSVEGRLSTFDGLSVGTSTDPGDNNLHVTGDVGIGVSPGNYRLEVQESVSFAFMSRFYNTDVDGDGVIVRAGPDTSGGTSNTAYFLYFTDGANNVLGYIRGNGTGINYYSASDERRKDVVGEIRGPDVLASLSNKRAVRYRVPGAPETDPEWIGLVAQDWQDVPGVVGEAKDGSLAVSYASVVPYLLAGQQALLDEINQLKARIAELEAA